MALNRLKEQGQVACSGVSYRQTTAAGHLNTFDEALDYGHQ
jgi:hypothetical protein